MSIIKYSCIISNEVVRVSINSFTSPNFSNVFALREKNLKCFYDEYLSFKEFLNPFNNLSVKILTTIFIDIKTN